MPAARRKRYFALLHIIHHACARAVAARLLVESSNSRLPVWCSQDVFIDFRARDRIVSSPSEPHHIQARMWFGADQEPVDPCEACILFVPSEDTRLDAELTTVRSLDLKWLGSEPLGEPEVAVKHAVRESRALLVTADC